MSLFNQQPGLFDQDRLTQVRKDKVAVKRQGSSLAGYDYRPTDCIRCGHPISTVHRPGRSVRCLVGNCTCLYAKSLCGCGHNSEDHESWGGERTTSCGRCECARFAPTPSTPNSQTGGQQ